MHKILCDGCDKPLEGRQVAIKIERTNGLGGGGMPDGEAHLCEDCGPFAWSAVLARRESLKDPHITCTNCGHPRRSHKTDGCTDRLDNDETCACRRMREMTP